MKVCEVCGESKPLSAYFRPTSLGCKSCYVLKESILAPERKRRYKSEYAKSHRDQWNDWEAQRRARKHGAFVETVKRSVVFERDGGICQLQISPKCPVTLDPDNWHVDHTISLSRKGEHSYANTRASCPPCNWLKWADREIVQTGT